MNRKAHASKIVCVWWGEMNNVLVWFFILLIVNTDQTKTLYISQNKQKWKCQFPRRILKNPHNFLQFLKLQEIRITFHIHITYDEYFIYQSFSALNVNQLVHQMKRCMREARGCNMSNKILWCLYFFQQHIFLSDFAAVLGFTLDRRLQSPGTSSQVHLSFCHIFESLPYAYPFLAYSRQSDKYKSFKWDIRRNALPVLCCNISKNKISHSQLCIHLGLKFFEWFKVWQFVFSL